MHRFKKVAASRLPEGKMMTMHLPLIDEPRRRATDAEAMVALRSVFSRAAGALGTLGFLPARSSSPPGAKLVHIFLLVTAGGASIVVGGVF
ncbi:hypothetical protein [Sorangium sp. So ce1182]|uniref:hypothetical protein n=1 Tax=Sorangium sp. So ce1182 TaxID=3133334 RepID=UPI003F631A70